MLRRRKKMLEYQRDLVAAHFAEVENMYRKMRAWRHDYHNHMQILSALIDSKNYSEAREYLDKINLDLTTVDTVVKTGNTMVDAILNSKLSLFASKNIPVTADAKVPEKLATDDLDLCIIIGNLLDNALEACLPLPSDKRFARIYIAPKKNTHLYICVTNSADRKRRSLGSRFVSTKGENHGFGLEKIDSLVAKYGGFLTRGSEDGGFTTEIMLPLADKIK
ncbi:MAG: GHKL domain-containing protein [Clostridia bacterium]|nr:GHKL domain-containing protein [Clostridia bacterium]